MEQKKRLLITGASGFLGWNIARHALERFTVIGAVNKHQTPLDIDHVSFDLSHYPSLKKCIGGYKPDLIIHTAAIANANHCVQFPEESYALNVNASYHLAAIAAEKNIPFCFCSTDLVFDGKKGNYNEQDSPNPISHYGEQKTIAEEKILAAYSNSLICRLPLMFGYSPTQNTGFFSGFLSQMQQKGEPLGLFFDEYRTPAFTDDIAKAMIEFTGKHRGLLHLGGKERVDRFSFGKQMAHIFDIANPNIKGISQKDVQLTVARPADVSLDSKLAFGMGFEPYLVHEALQKLKPLYA